MPKRESVSLDSAFTSSGHVPALALVRVVPFRTQAPQQSRSLPRPSAIQRTERGQSRAEQGKPSARRRVMSGMCSSQVVQACARRIGRHDADLDRDRSPHSNFDQACSQALFRWLLLDPVAALCNGNDPDWRRYICGTEERCIGLVIGEILIDAPERVLG
jgi:hypothetical protein